MIKFNEILPQKKQIDYYIEGEYFRKKWEEKKEKRFLEKSLANYFLATLHDYIYGDIAGERFLSLIGQLNPNDSRILTVFSKIKQAPRSRSISPPISALLRTADFSQIHDPCKEFTLDLWIDYYQSNVQNSNEKFNLKNLDFINVSDKSPPKLAFKIFLIKILATENSDLDLVKSHQENKNHFLTALEYSSVVLKLLQHPQMPSIYKNQTNTLEKIEENSSLETAIQTTVVSTPDALMAYLRYHNNNHGYFTRSYAILSSLKKLTKNQTQELLSYYAIDLPSTPGEFSAYIIGLVQLIFNYPELFTSQIINLFSIATASQRKVTDHQTKAWLNTVNLARPIKDLPGQLYIFIAKLFTPPDGWFKVFNHILFSFSETSCLEILLAHPLWSDVNTALKRNLLPLKSIPLILAQLIIPDIKNFSTNFNEMNLLLQLLFINPAYIESAIKVAKKYPELTASIYQYGIKLNKFSLEKQKEFAKFDIHIATEFINQLGYLETNPEKKSELLEEIGQSQPLLCYTCGILCRELGQYKAAARLFEEVPETSEDYENAQLEYYSILISYLAEENKEQNSTQIKNLFNEIKNIRDRHEDLKHLLQPPAPIVPQDSYTVITASTTNSTALRQSENTDLNNNNDLSAKSDNNEQKTFIKKSYPHDEQPTFKTNLMKMFSAPTLKTFIEKYKNFSWTSMASQKIYDNAAKAKNWDDSFKIFQKYVLDSSNNNRDLRAALDDYFGEDFFTQENNHYLQM